jgi:hypothetical protein
MRPASAQTASRAVRATGTDDERGKEGITGSAKGVRQTLWARESSSSDWPMRTAVERLRLNARARG